MKRFSRHLLSLATSAAILMASASPALSAYRRPQDARPPSPATGTSGTRDGSLMGENGLRPTTLAPRHHVGKTLSAYPTFTWFMPVDETIPVEFQLYEVTGENTFVRVFDQPYRLESTPGLMSFTVPESTDGYIDGAAGGLEPGKDYIWQVLLRYGPGRSDIYVMRSQVQVVAADQLPISLSDDEAIRIEQLAEAGFWYDALALVTRSPSEANNNRRIELLQELADADREMGIGDTDETMSEDAIEENAGSAEAEEAADGISAEQTQATDQISHHQALRLIAKLIAK